MAFGRYHIMNTNISCQL